LILWKLNQDVSISDFRNVTIVARQNRKSLKFSRPCSKQSASFDRTLWVWETMMSFASGRTTLKRDRRNWIISPDIGRVSRLDFVSRCKMIFEAQSAFHAQIGLTAVLKASWSSRYKRFIVARTYTWKI
jgi:hypothetical protein